MATGKTYIVKDVMEAYFESTNGKNYFIGLTTESGLARAVSQEPIRAGIGAKTVGVLNSDEGYTANITTGLYYEDIAELQIGTEFESVTDIEIQEVTESEDGTVTAAPATVSGNALELEAGAFGKSGKLQLHTIIHNEDNEVVGDLYIILDKASPDSNFEQTFGMNTNNIQNIAFTALVPKGQTSYGRYVIVPRVTPEP